MALEPQASQPETVPAPVVEQPAIPELRVDKPKKDKKKKGNKSAETLFRTTMSNHMKLSDMADRKANLMISINTIAISVVLSAYTYTRKVDAHTELLVPSILLLIVCLITIITSLIATNPTIAPLPDRSGIPKPAPVDLLFFGYYARLTADEYRDQLRKLLTSEEDIYTSMIDNIYAQGLVLSRKYRLLKFAYQFFMIGFSVVVLIAAIMLLVSFHSV